MRTLIVCEKNDAAKQIARALSGGASKQRRGTGVPVYELEWDGHRAAVMGLRGHVMETDFVKGHERWSAKADKLHALVDAPVRKIVTEENIVAALRKEAGKAERIIVATDYDREGELIGVEALEAIGDLADGKPVRRARYSSFTRKEVDHAFGNLVDVDRRLAAAGEARQVIDLAWGAALTRFLSVVGGRRGRGFLSVGRVQTPTLGLIVDREKEILAFKSDAYWDVMATLEAPDGGQPVPFEAQHPKSGYVRGSEGGFAGRQGHFQSLQEAQAAASAIRNAGKARVVSVETKEATRRAPIPFSTTGFQQAASSLGYGVKRAMDIAQKLYLAGYISYHRTENTVYPATLDLAEILGTLAASGPVAADAAWVKTSQRKEPTRGNKETTDHPPIYPTAVPPAGAKLGDGEWRLWELVARRFLATLSPDARVQTVAAAFEAGDEPLRASGQTTLEPGWRRVYPYTKSEDTTLPPLKQGQDVPVRDAKSEAKETQPPKRYGQGGLIAEMERLGIGTKATRHETIQKLIDRGYITEEPVQPTLVGFAVTAALEEHAQRITDAEMTARLEEEMTQIEQGQRTLEATLEDSRTLLHDVVETLARHEEPIRVAVRKALEDDAHVGSCPDCGNKLLVRQSRFGTEFIGCKGYPECRVTYGVPRGKVAFLPEPCAECGAPRAKHKDRSGEREVCLNAECPTRQAMAAEERQELGTCPKCTTGTLAILRSRNFKRYVRCENEACDQTYPLPQRGAVSLLDARCEHCGAPRVRVLNKNRPPWDICINMECPGREKREGKDDASAASGAPRRSARGGSKGASRTAKPAAKGKGTAARARRPDAPPAEPEP